MVLWSAAIHRRCCPLALAPFALLLFGPRLPEERREPREKRVKGGDESPHSREPRPRALLLRRVDRITLGRPTHESCPCPPPRAGSAPSSWPPWAPASPPCPRPPRRGSRGRTSS